MLTNPRTPYYTLYSWVHVCWCEYLFTDLCVWIIAWVAWPQLQSTLVISNSFISNNRLSRSANLVPVLTQRSTIRQQNIVEKRRNCSGFILLKVVVRLIVFLSSANLICRSTDISKCFIESLGFRDNESRLYFIRAAVVPYVMFVCDVCLSL